MGITRRVKVHNDDTKAYSEVFRDEMLTIPAKSYIEMEDGEATLFMGRFPGLRRDGTGRDLTVKMLRKEYITHDMETVSAVKCMACGTEFKTASELEVHSKVHEAAQIKESPATKKKFFS